MIETIRRALPRLAIAALIVCGSTPSAAAVQHTNDELLADIAAFGEIDAVQFVRAKE